MSRLISTILKIDKNIRKFYYIYSGVFGVIFMLFFSINNNVGVAIKNFVDILGFDKLFIPFTTMYKRFLQCNRRKILYCGR